MAPPEKYQWHKIAEDLADLNFSSNGLREILVNGKTICLAMHNNTIHACTHKCPHAGGILSEGYLDVSGNIVCPLHRYKFDMKNGRNTSGEGYFLKTYPVEARVDGIYLGTDPLSPI